MSDYYKAREGENYWPDAYADGEYGKRPGKGAAGAGYPPAPALPAPAPGRGVPAMYPTQLPPVVQPLVIVPYSSQTQPLLTFTPDMSAYGEYRGVPGEAAWNYSSGGGTESPALEKSEKVEKKRRANVGAIFILIFSLLLVLTLALPRFADIPYFDFVTSANVSEAGSEIDSETGAADTAFGRIETLVTDFPSLSGDVKLLVGYIGLAAGAVCGAITLILSLFSLAARKVPVITKIFAILSFVGMAACLIIAFVRRESPFVGMITPVVLSGLAFLTAIFSRKRKDGGGRNE